MYFRCPRRPLSTASFRGRQSRSGRLLLAAAFCLLPALVGAQPTTTRVSVRTGDAQVNGASDAPVVSPDGRWVAFDSIATDLVASDTNGFRDVFIHDRLNKATTRISLGPGAIEANGDSSAPSISADGRWVAFESQATNLVPNDTNGFRDVFVHDRQLGTTTRVSLGRLGALANGHSRTPAISAEGRLVAFASRASNLVSGDTNNSWDVFVYDRQTVRTTRVSVGLASAQANSNSYAPALSLDGRWVAFHSEASDLVVGDTNEVRDVFVHDRETLTTTLASVRTGGIQGNDDSEAATISADGRWVAFTSLASTLVTGDTNNNWDVFVRDRDTATTTRVSVGPAGVQANNRSDSARMSADGRWVAFASRAGNLVAGDTNGAFDVFVHDRLSATTTRASVGTGGTQANGLSRGEAISPDGRWVAFWSEASNLVAGDTNGFEDVFVHDRGDAGCATMIAPTSASAPAEQTAGHLAVVASTGCDWTAISNDPSWLTLTGASSGTGSAVVSYTVAANLGGARTGTLTIAGTTFTVSQSPYPAPLPPAGLTVHSIVGNVVTLRWTVLPGAPAPTQFVLEGGLKPGEVLASLPTRSLVPTFSFAAPTGSFYVRLYALSGAFRSAPSNEIPLHVNVPVAPSAPANLQTLVAGSTLALAWTNTHEGGLPESLVLEVTGSLVTAVPLSLNDNVSFAGVPAGTYTLSLRAQNASGLSPPSNTATVVIPGPCSGPPMMPTNVLGYRIGRTVFLDWALNTSGPAPTSFLVNVTGSFVGSLPTVARALSGTVAPGSYTVSVVAVNPCGASPATAPQTVIVP